jgi:hypothetical protein
MLLRVRQAEQLAAMNDALAASTERSNSHELSMLHPTRLSLSTNGATPQAAQAQGWARRVLKGGIVHSTMVYKYTLSQVTGLIRGSLMSH